MKGHHWESTVEAQVGFWDLEHLYHTPVSWRTAQTWHKKNLLQTFISVRNPHHNKRQYGGMHGFNECDNLMNVQSSHFKCQFSFLLWKRVNKVWNLKKAILYPYLYFVPLQRGQSEGSELSLHPLSKMARVQSLSNFGSTLLFSEDKFGSLSLAWNWKKNVINVVYAIYWQNHPFSTFTSNCSDLILLVLEDTFKVTRCTSLWKARQSFGRGVSSLSLLCFLCQGRRCVAWGGGDGGLYQPLTIAGSGWMILAVENRGSQPVAAFPAGRDVDRVAATSWGAKENWLTCYLWQASCWCLVWPLC